MTTPTYKNKRYPSDFVGPPIQKASAYILQRIQRRCKVCEDCGAPWHWDVAVSPGATPLVNVCGHILAIRRAVYMLKTGRVPPKGKLATASCPNPHCCDPEKVTARRVSAMVRDTYRSGARDPSRSLRVLAQYTHTHNRKLSTAQVIAIRGDPRTPQQGAPAYGITPEYYRAIKAGRRRTEASQLGTNASLGMFAGLLRSADNSSATSERRA